MKLRKQGNSQEKAAARSNISLRSGRRIEKGEGGPKHRQERKHRTRQDPLAGVWEQELVPMLEAQPKLIAVTLFEYLQHRYPKKYPDAIRRTLERRVKKWKAEYGPDKEVIFRQIHEPGLMGLSDFTEIKKAFTVTICGKKLEHRLFHFRLIFSGWAYVQVIQSGESFVALTSSLNEAFNRLGGAPKTHRTDSLSAAYKNLNSQEQEDMTKRYKEFCEHYGMLATRNNPGVSHENGGVESPHRHLKRRISQALMLRGSSDFSSVESYEKWLDALVTKQNQRIKEMLTEEQRHLLPLPGTPGIDYDELVVRVASTSTVSIKRVTYSVPSRLIGEQLRAQVHERHIELFLGSSKILTLDKVTTKGNKRSRKIDLSHIIDSLVKKPQAFRYSVYQDEMMPNDQFRTIWKRVDQEMEPRFACKYFVNLLNIAVKGDCVGKLGDYLLESEKLPPLHEIQNLFYPIPTSSIELHNNQHKITEYDQLIYKE